MQGLPGNIWLLFLLSCLPDSFSPAPLAETIFNVWRYLESDLGL